MTVTYTLSKPIPAPVCRYLLRDGKAVAIIWESRTGPWMIAYRLAGKDNSLTFDERGGFDSLEAAQRAAVQKVEELIAQGVRVFSPNTHIRTLN